MMGQRTMEQKSRNVYKIKIYERDIGESDIFKT